ncbi:penicillin acylase family protein [Desulfobacula sp.]|uniref:penicillin acylase family protein n=1 Tax=Desulfobacula sp. TaxID=2593537 RepID=UPI002620DF05|nr:penicillin acylase family protein [Desulfobacula sp.]
MKGFRRILTLIIGLAACIVILVLYLPFLNDFKTKGTLTLPGLTDRVTIQRDENGMAYIHARNLEDGFMAQGFVTAQDRLFQMQLTRLVVQGRVCELAGPVAKNLDIRMRTIGLHRMAKKQANILNDQTKGYFQKYVDGINAFIALCPDDIHLEFKLAGITPENWNVVDSLGILYYMGYSTSANLNTEITAQMLLETLGYEKACQLMPVNINADDPDDTGNLKIPPKDHLSISPTGIKDVLAYTGNLQLRVGSNNWAVSPGRSASGSTLLAGDPHLDVRILPGVWYPLGLITPETRAVGVNIPGIPGMAIGRTDHLALSVTNNYGDMQDLYIETIDPENSDNYLEGKTTIPFIQIRETLKIKDKDDPKGYRMEPVTIRATRRGPVVSKVLPDLTTQKVISFRFAPAESMEPFIGLIEILTAKNAADLVKVLKNIPMVCLNWVFADTSGNIGHQASGKIPIRHNGDGTFPFPVKNAGDNWHGWIPQDQMPGTLNPEKNWIGTCNQKTIKHDYPYYYSSYFAPSYRYRRVKELMASSNKKTIDDLWMYQRDTKNLMAQSLSPIMANALLKHEDTRIMGNILSAWDFRDDPEKAAPAIFQATYRLFAMRVFEDDLGEENAMILLNNWYFWQERLEHIILTGDAAWIDDTRTTDTMESLEDLFHQAAVTAKTFLSSHLGDTPEKWQWGKVHALELVNPIRRKGIGKALLGSGPMPMGGSGETLYRGSYDYDTPFAVSYCAALRMVADLSDREKVLAVLPGGVTGRTFRSHQKDQVAPFMSGEKRYWWFSDTAIDEHQTSKLILVP